MRCTSCNKSLNDYESTRKDTHGNYLDFCNKCYRDIEKDVPTVDRTDLAPNEESIDDEIFDIDEDEFEDYVDGDSYGD